MLKRIHIHNYRTFVNFEWQPPQACVLVGENGAGKSSLIDVLWLLQDLLVHGRRLDETSLRGTRTAWRQDKQQTIEIDVAQSGQEFRYRCEFRVENGRDSIREILSTQAGTLYRSGDGKVELFGDEPLAQPRTSIGFDRRRSFLASLEPRSDNQKVMTFRSWLDSFWGIKPDPPRLASTATGESPWLERDLSNFADWYRNRVQEDPDAMQALREDLKGVLVGFDQLRLEPIAADVKELRARFRFGEQPHELAWRSLSDGERLLIALYGFMRFALPRARFVALDEVENYVAPNEIQPWLRQVNDTVNSAGGQLLAVSHHPESIDYLAADSLWRMWRDPAAGHTRISKVEPDLDAGETAYDSVKMGMLND